MALSIQVLCGADDKILKMRKIAGLTCSCLGIFGCLIFTIIINNYMKVYMKI